MNKQDTVINSGPNTEQMKIDEDIKLDETVKLINRSGILLKCTNVTRAKALLIYHHFRSCVLETEYEPHTIAAACISLSIKCSEENISLESIVNLFFRMMHKERIVTQSKNFKAALNAVSLLEIVIMRMVEFDISHAIAHQYLQYFMADFRDELSDVWDVFSVTTLRLANDFYLTNKCMMYRADEIAYAVVKLSLQNLGYNDDFIKLRLRNWNDVSKDTIQCIIEDILSICCIEHNFKVEL